MFNCAGRGPEVWIEELEGSFFHLHTQPEIFLHNEHYSDNVERLRTLLPHNLKTTNGGHNNSQSSALHNLYTLRLHTMILASLSTTKIFKKKFATTHEWA